MSEVFNQQLSCSKQPPMTSPFDEAWVAEQTLSVFSLTWGSERITLIVQATVNMILLFLLASLMPRGLRMADCLSKLMTTVTKAQEYIATSFRNMSSLQAVSPACHCTVMFHAASRGITMKVTSRSATVRFIMRILTWDLRLPPLLAAHSTAKLQTADTAHRVNVIMTRTLAAVEKVGSWSTSPSALLLHTVEAPWQLPFTVWSAGWWNIMRCAVRLAGGLKGLQGNNPTGCLLSSSASPHGTSPAQTAERKTSNTQLSSDALRLCHFYISEWGRVLQELIIVSTGVTL